MKTIIKNKIKLRAAGRGRRTAVWVPLLVLLWHGLVFASPSSVWIDSFDYQTAEKYPKGWRIRSQKSYDVYTVKKHPDRGQYLQARASKTAETIGVFKKVDIAKYPYLNWTWRANNLPPGGNESVKSKCDHAASVYLVISSSRLAPKSIKYTWSTTLPVGKRTESPFAIWPARADIIVLQSGTAKKGKWVRQKRNVLKDYAEFYGETPESLVVDGVAIMTDADNTGSYSAADYDNIYFSAN